MSLSNIRSWSTPITIGSFIVMLVTGILMFFHLNLGLNKFAHEWIGLIFSLFAVAHLVANFKAFTKHIEKPIRAFTVFLGAVILLASCFQLFEVEPSGSKIIVNKVASLPLETVVSFSDKSQETIADILKAHHFEDADMTQTPLALADGDKKRASNLLIEIFQK